MSTSAAESGRNETELERLDRNWAELMQELRVTQMGTQIMTGFLLAVAFQPRFAELTHFQFVTYLALVILGVLTTALGLVPVSLHRTLFRRGLKNQIVELGHVFVRFTLLGVGLMLCGTILLIFDVTLGMVPALVACGTLLVLLLVVGVLLPRWASSGAA